jgi:hypothetical protein
MTDNSLLGILHLKAINLQDASMPLIKSNLNPSSPAKLQPSRERLGRQLTHDGEGTEQRGVLFASA